MNELRQFLTDIISVDVRGGFASREQIIDSACLAAEGDAPELEIEALATRIVDEVLAVHALAQRSWIGETDCERLDEAFAELDRQGIVARQNFTCCQSCGHSEIANEIEATEVFRPVRGYVFYHIQDLESVVRNGYLYLAFGSVSGELKESEIIAQEICEILRKAGLEPDWNGSIRTRICIRDLNWQRRRYAEDTEGDSL